MKREAKRTNSFFRPIFSCKASRTSSDRKKNAIYLMYTSGWLAFVIGCLIVANSFEDKLSAELNKNPLFNYSTAFNEVSNKGDLCR